METSRGRPSAGRLIFVDLVSQLVGWGEIIDILFTQSVVNGRICQTPASAGLAGTGRCIGRRVLYEFR